MPSEDTMMAFNKSQPQIISTITTLSISDPPPVHGLSIEPHKPEETSPSPLGPQMPATANPNPGLTFTCHHPPCHLRSFPTHRLLIRHKSTSLLHEYCRRCDLDFPSITAKLIHLIESDRHLACAECGEEFGCVDGLIAHVRRVHGHTLRLVLQAIDEEERRARIENTELAEEGLPKPNFAPGTERTGPDLDGVQHDEAGHEIQSSPHCLVDQTEWMGIRMAKKRPPFW